MEEKAKGEKAKEDKEGLIEAQEDRFDQTGVWFSHQKNVETYSGFWYFFVYVMLTLLIGWVVFY